MGLLIVGTGHVFHIEAPIRALIHRERPQVVALELDAGRFQGLLERRSGTFDAEAAHRRAGRVYRALARFQEEVAGSLGVDVGAEMLAAAQAAHAVGSRLALIDRNAEEAVSRLWKEMGLREKLRLLASGLAARFGRGARTVEQEVARYQADPEGYLEDVGRSYPTVKRILIDERNTHMAAQLRDLVGSNPNVVAVVGDGHVDGLVRLLRDLAPRTVRLAELRAAASPAVRWRLGPKGESVGFSFDVESPEGTFRNGP